jgi:hypothetical protein
MDEPSDRQRWPALEKDEAGLLNELLALLTARVVGNPYATDGSFAANIAGRAVRFHRPDNWRDGNRQGTCCTGYPPAIKARLARACDCELRCYPARSDRLGTIWP